jgi:hypothetical protein
MHFFKSNNLPYTTVQRDPFFAKMHAVNLLARVGLFSHSPSVTGIYRLPTARDQIFLIFNRLCNPLQGDWQQKLDQLLKKKREMSYLAAADQSRRIFRGRGGPTDRRLPKQNAARRQPQRTNEEMELYQQQQRESRKTNIESNGNHRHNDTKNISMMILLMITTQQQNQMRQNYQKPSARRTMMIRILPTTKKFIIYYVAYKIIALPCRHRHL